MMSAQINSFIRAKAPHSDTVSYVVINWIKDSQYADVSYFRFYQAQKWCPIFQNKRHS